jgi:L-2,4-diaminobutyrate decarboxylase
MLGLKLYATLSLLGTRFLRDYVEGCWDLARRFGEAIADAPDFELALPPQCNIVCFRHRPPGSSDGAGAALDAHQTALRERVLKSGAFYLVQTRLRDGVFLRTTLVNPLTTDDDLAALLGALRDAA